MAGIVKSSMRIVVISGVAVGAAAVIAGPQRVAALAKSAQSRVVTLIDANIDDPIVLRTQLRDLAAKYPERISAVRGDLAELREQMRQINRDREIGERVVRLADQDLESLRDMLARAQDARDQAGPGETVLVAFNNRNLTLADAYAQATRIQQTRAAYASRADDANRTLTYLEQQANRLQELLDKLESEHAEFQAQLWQLDQQVDAVARNDRLINMLEQRQKTIDEHSRFEVASLEQLQSRMNQIRARQESQFASLEQSRNRVDYEDEARRLLEAERAAKDAFEQTSRVAPTFPTSSRTIRIQPAPAADAPKAGDAKDPERIAARTITPRDN
ncbi:MAG: hypothetical protein EA379_02460 [Phycisphaerales bacterium]|jgi:chromosome segregation ATPase|nr:MAG: hypothetical protein EA379_02460 [Phycisphaerales bacterium]